ncbi:hypothetical protein ACH47Z_40045 [Streptomyces sp. NPDC020192]|uniref:hypothetical protein n=1 Tax=Streptomyces sp. NPDC020192 TaxID=3365066 RepID=UPI003793F38E
MSGGLGNLTIRPHLPEAVTFDGDLPQDRRRELELVLRRAVARAVAGLGEEGMRVAGAPVAAAGVMPVPAAVAEPAAEPAVEPAAVPTAEPVTEPAAGGLLLAFGLSAEAAEAAEAATGAGPGPGPAERAAVPAATTRAPVHPAGTRQPGAVGGRGRAEHTPARLAQRTEGTPGRKRPTPAEPAGGGGPQGTRFRVRLTPAMGELGPAKLLREFVRQYYRATSEQEVDRLLPAWRWTEGRERSASARDVGRGFIELTVTDVTATAMAALPPTERERIDQEADERFRQEAGLPPGTRRPGTGPQDAALHARWLAARADVAAEHDLRRKIANLPEDVKDILFAGGLPLNREDLEPVLRLGGKFSGLTPAQRADYLSKVTAETTSWAELDASIERYLRAEEARGAEAARTEAAAAELFGCEDLYRLWQALNAVRARATRAGPKVGVYPALRDELNAATAHFQESLKRHGFTDEAAFVSAMDAYRLQFRAEAVAIGLDVLARFDHLLHEERRKLRSPGYVESMVAGIARTQARAEFETAAAKEQLAMQFAMRGVGAMAGRYQAEAVSLRAAAGQAVVTSAGEDPLVDAHRLGRGTDREKLARLDTPDLRTYLLGVADERQAEAATVRGEFTGDPERVFSLPGLVEATKQSQGAGADTIYAWIVDDHVKAVGQAHSFTATVLVLISLVLAAVVPVGGWVAAAALVATAGISVYQATEAIAEYRRSSTEYDLSFIDTEPSLIWVGVAVVAAAVDLGSVATLLTASAKGLVALKVPLRSFSTATDIETAAARYRALTAKIDEVEGLAPKLRETLKAHAAAELGLKRVVGEFAGRLHGGFLVDPTGPMQAMYYAVKKGVTKFAALRTEARLTELLGDVTRLTGAELAEIKTAFGRVKEIVRIGEQRTMDDATLLRYVDRLAARRSEGASAFEEIVAEMRAWHRPTSQQLAAEAALTKASEELAARRLYEAELEFERSALRKEPLETRDVHRIREIDTELVALAGERGRTGQIVKEGLITRAVRDMEKAAKAAEAARVSPLVRMRQAFNASRERAQVLARARVDEVGRLRVSSGLLEVDHIVSLVRISRMEGFELLTAAEREALAVRIDDMVLMDASANASKGERSWAAWPQAGTFYDPEVIARWRAIDAERTRSIEEWILMKVRGRTPARVRVGAGGDEPRVRIHTGASEPMPEEPVELPAEEAPKKRLRNPRNPER